MGEGRKNRGRGRRSKFDCGCHLGEASVRWRWRGGRTRGVQRLTLDQLSLVHILELSVSYLRLESVKEGRSLTRPCSLPKAPQCCPTPKLSVLLIIDCW